MTLFSKKYNLKKGRNIYFNVEPEEIVVYETIIVDDILKKNELLLWYATTLIPIAFLFTFIVNLNNIITEKQSKMKVHNYFSIYN
jgi:hypothetical protein